jgi:hypothetical protein
MPVWTDGKDGGIASLDAAEFANEVLFGEGDVPGGLECKSHLSDEYQFLLVQHMRVDRIGHRTWYQPRYLSTHPSLSLPLLFAWDGIYSRDRQDAGIDTREDQLHKEIHRRDFSVVT